MMGPMDLSHASVLISGGASGLGAATARRLAPRAGGVVLIDVDETRGAEVAADVGARFVAADVTDPTGVAAAVAEAEAMAPLRAAVCCAGIGPAARMVHRDGTAHSLALFEKVVSVNLVGTFNVARLAAQAIAKHDPLATGDRGALVFTASIAAFEGQKGQAAYAASKAGVAAMVLPLARDLASRRIRVLGVAPGTFSTPMLHGLRPEQVEALKANVVHPERLGEPTEFAQLVEVLLDSPYLNGEIVRIDGALRLA